MTCPSRPKPLTLIFCCAGTLAAGFAGQVEAQPPPLFRVDPALLGLPPIKVDRPQVTAPADRPVAEAKAVEEATVESRPLPAPPAAAAAREARPAAVVQQAPPPAVTARPAAAPATVAQPQQTPRPTTPPAQAESAVAKPSIGSAAPAASASPPDPPSPTPQARRPDSPPAPAELQALPVDSAVAASGSDQSVPAVSEPAPGGPAVASEELPRVPADAARVEPPAATEQAMSDDLPLLLRMARTMVPPAKESSVPRPAFLSAQRLSGVVDRELVADGDAELRKVGTVLTGDRLTYWPVEDEVEAVGSARLQQGDDVIAGPKMRLKIEDQVGFVEQASYFLKRQSGVPAGGLADPRWELPQSGDEPNTGFAAPRVMAIKPGQTRVTLKKPENEVTEGRGEAERIDLEGENQFLLTSATYTTCKPGNDDWHLSAADLKLDYDNDIATGHDATIHFLGVPILHSPWVSFSLNNERKSGFLTPSYGSTSDSGVEVRVPYYWNIAPNMDATIEPRILTKRGIQVGTEFRYLNAAYGGTYSGTDVVEYLPNDREAKIDRWGVALSHSQTMANGFSGLVNYNRVSDNDYYTDLSSQISSTSKTQLLQQGLLSYGASGWWTATANVQTYQTLQPDPQNPVTKPYRLLPQITVNARQPDLYFTDSAFFGQYTSFVSPNANQVEGQRTVLQPQVSLPFVTPAWYVIPRMGVNVTHYSLSDPVAGSVLPNSINRTLPIFSVDSGMTFERPSNWFGRDYTQTLEPRLFYLNIPYKNQNDIPIFDTALADFNFAQIFADNQFSGWDRINNANQVTAAVSSRLIDPSNGGEIMRGMIGQIFYFTDDRVVLPGTTTRKWDKSDFLAAFSGQVLPKVYLDAALQYDLGDQDFQRYAVGARYLPGPGKVLNASYRYNIDAATPINEFDLSGQWPISSRWQALGRYTYAFKNDTSGSGTTTSVTSTGGTPVEIIGGLEYNAGCWAVRAVGHRIQTTQADSVTQFFVQLELSDLGRVGSSPLSVLQRRIPGYSLARPMADQGLAEQ